MLTLNIYLLSKGHERTMGAIAKCDLLIYDKIILRDMIYKAGILDGLVKKVVFKNR